MHFIKFVSYHASFMLIHTNSNAGWISMASPTLIVSFKYMQYDRGVDLKFHHWNALCGHRY